MDVSDLLVAEADDYHRRNSAVQSKDRVLEVIRDLPMVERFRSVLEIGCATGNRLNALAETIGCEAVGLDASRLAIHQAQKTYPSIQFVDGLAPEALETKLGGRTFDCVILGFFMYLLPREELFRLGSSVDALLADSGVLVVHDFLSPTPTRANYVHKAGLTTYKMNPSALWLWNPVYSLITRKLFAEKERPNDASSWEVIDVLLKRPVASSYEATTPMPSAHGNS